MTSVLHEAEVVHHIPGRLRLKVPGAKGNPAALDEIRSALLATPGVKDISANPITSSVLVLYEDHHHAVIHEAVAHHGGKHIRMKPKEMVKRPPKVGEVSEVASMIEEEAEFLAEHSHAARLVVNFCRDLDDGVKRVTKNAVDLKVLVPLGLAVVTFLEIGATAATPVWLTLGLFSMNHFVELHAHEMEDEEEEDGEEAAAAEEEAG